MPSNLTVLITLGSRQVPYEAHISWETLSSYRTTVAAFNIGAFPVIFPVYIYVVWLLLSKTDIKNSMPYQIMLNINFIDLVFLVENLMAGYFAFQHDHYHFHLRTLSEVLSCLRFGTLLANPFLYFTLALNRLIVVLNVRPTKCFSVLFFAMNITALLLFTFLPLILNFFTHTIHTTFNEIRAMYAFEAEGAIQIFIGVFGPVLYAASFLCYVAIVASILMKKHLYGASHSISPLEVRLIVQAFFLSVPPAVLILVGMAVTTQMGTSVWIYLFWNILSAVLPANTLINYILFNPIIRGHLFRITGKKSIVRPPTTVVQNTTTGQTKPVVVTVGRFLVK